MENRGLVFWLCISGFIHSLVYFSGSILERSSATNEISVSLQETLAPNFSASPQKEYPRVPERKIPSIPTQAAKAFAPTPKAKTTSAPTRTASSPKITNSGELLSDPQKGKVFSKYFLKIKQKIYQAAEDHYFPHQARDGRVSLIFIINKEGNLEDVYVSSRDTQANNQTKAFAVQSVKEAAPFDSFPSVLNTDKICFNLTLLFDQLSKRGQN